MVEVKERPKTRGERADAATHSIRNIGVVGAGQMGSGIAHVCALAGFHVLLNDVAVERFALVGAADVKVNCSRTGRDSFFRRRCQFLRSNRDSSVFRTRATAIYCSFDQHGPISEPSAMFCNRR